MTAAHIRHILLTGIACFCVFMAATVQAERWYEIEVILFEQATDERLASESWETTTELPNLSAGRDFISQPPHLQTPTQLCIGSVNYSVTPVPIREIPVEVDMFGPDDFADSPLLEQPGLTQEPEDTGEIEKEPELPYVLLDESNHQLQEVYQQLRRRRGYRMLFHEAWRQPANTKEESLPVRIYAGKDFGDTFNYSGDAIVELESTPTDLNLSDASGFNDLVLNTSAFSTRTFERFNQEQIIDPMMDIDIHFQRRKSDIARAAIDECAIMEREAIAKQRQPVWQIDGHIHIYRERFRHVETDLVIRFPDTEEVDLRAIETNLAADELLATIDLDNTESSFDWQFDENFLTSDLDDSTVTRDVLKYFPMQQSRRIIDSKIHYFDHPLMGLIIQLRTYDPEEETSL